jgi:hypothetical protein
MNPSAEVSGAADDRCPQVRTGDMRVIAKRASQGRTRSRGNEFSTGASLPSLVQRRANAALEGLTAWWSANVWAWRREYAPGRFRRRTRARMFTPWWLLNLGLFERPADDCGSHEWFNHDDVTAQCRHCAVGQGPWPPAE